MSLYPTLEDMTVDQYSQAQNQATNVINQQQQQFSSQPQYPSYATPAYPHLDQGYSHQNATSSYEESHLYPALTEYMGLKITPEMIAENQLAIPTPNQVAVPSATSGMVAPITGHNNVGLMRSDIKKGIRSVVVCKDAKGRIGLKVKSVDKGIFICFVEKGSPASMAGLRFGDQILQINDKLVAGWDTSKTLNFLKKAAPEKITMAIRDRPFDRTITMHKDSAGCVGFMFNKNKITDIAKDSSAARNGLLINHYMVEVNGQNVIAMKDKEMKDMFDAADRTITITIIPSYLYEHIMKNMGSSLLKKMDHSIPDV